MYYSLCLSETTRGRNPTKIRASVGDTGRACSHHYLNSTNLSITSKRPSECPIRKPTPTKVIRLSKCPGVAPTGPRQAPRHRKGTGKVATLVLPTLRATDRHRGLILNSGNGSVPSMRMDRVLSHARSFSARWLTEIGLVRFTASNQPPAASF